MSPYSLFSVSKIEAVICHRIQAIRLDRNITQVSLATEAGVSVRTIKRLENGEGTSLATFISVMKALGLDARLEALLPEEQIQPIARVNKATYVRERASGKRKKASDDASWQWGDE